MESISGTIWVKSCNTQTFSSWFLSHINEIIWDNLPHLEKESISTGSFTKLTFSMVHSGDITDEEIILNILMDASKIFNNFTFRIKTAEGDFIMFETVQFVKESIDIPEETSIIFNGKIHHVNESICELNDLPERLNNDTEFNDDIQRAFQMFLDSIKNKVIYHGKKLLIPTEFKRLLLFNKNLISNVIKKVGFKNLDVKSMKFSEHRILFRKYQFAYLSSMDIRVPKEFGELCKDKELSYIKMSYLLSVGFKNILKSHELDKEIEKAKEAINDETLNKLSEEDDDNEDWLNNLEKPEFNFEDIGQEMAERVGEFMNEISEFDKIEQDGPLNFDYDKFKDKLEHFLDSDYEEEELNSEYEEEEEEDELMKHLDDEEELLLRKVANGKKSPDQYLNQCLERSFDSQPSESGPTSDLIHLFNLQK